VESALRAGAVGVAVSCGMRLNADDLRQVRRVTARRGRSAVTGQAPRCCPRHALLRLARLAGADRTAGCGGAGRMDRRRTGA
jgi:hypothetical protein